MDALAHELFKQEFSHFARDQFRLHHETIVVTIGNLDDFGMGKSALKFSHDRSEDRLPYVFKVLTERGDLLFSISAL